MSFPSYLPRRTVRIASSTSNRRTSNIRSALTCLIVSRDAQANVAGNIVAAFLHIFGEEAVADRSQEILRNALRALMEAPSPSLLRIPRLLTDDAYREKVVARITDPVVAHYWNVRFVAGDRAYRHQATAPILNKLDHFLSNPLLRNILGQSTSSFSVRRLMDEGGSTAQ